MVRLSKIAAHIGASCLSDIEIESIATLKEAKGNMLSFYNDSRYEEDLKQTQAAAVLITQEYADRLPSGVEAIVCEDAYLALAHISALFAPKLDANEYEPMVGQGCSIAPSARFGKGVEIGDNVTIMSGVYIGQGCKIGSNCIIHPNVTIYHQSIIGNGVIIHGGTVVGSDGYGFAHTKLGEHVKIYQNGQVVIEDEVEIGANCTIDRAVFGVTRIQRGTKLDNLIQIGHNCDIGAFNLMASQAGISGSTITGRNCVMGGQSGTAGHLKIGDFVTVAARGGVTKDVEQKGTYAGFPLMPIRSWRRLQATFARLIK